MDGQVAGDDHGACQDSDGDGEEDDVAIQGDPSALAIEPCDSVGEVVAWEIHIVYSPIWQTPVLYIMASHADGRPLPWDMMEGLLSSRFRSTDGDSVDALDR